MLNYSNLIKFLDFKLGLIIFYFYFLNNFDEEIV